MLLNLKHVLLLCACVASQALAELFTSMAHMQKALVAEKDIASEIRQYIQAQEERLKNLERVAAEFDMHSAKALENPDFYLANPVNVFLFVKYFTLDWDRDIDPVVRNNSVDELVERIEVHRQDLPTYEDLTGSVSALLRLQDTYKLDTSSIARGDLGGAVSSQLTVEECFEIGRQTYRAQDFYHTVMWMQEALDRTLLEPNHTVPRSVILDYLTYSTFKQGNIRHALSLTNELLTLEPDHARAYSNKLYYQKMLEDEMPDEASKRGDDGEISIQNKRQLDDYRNSEEFNTYERLCRGEDTHPYKYKHRLRCRYRDNKHPFLFLQPAKEEDVFLNPWLVIYHDIMSDKEIEVIKQLATPKLGRATVHNVATGKLETATYRISKSAWLKGEEHPVVEKVNKRIEAITGLNVQTAEELQIANYGIGGHYEPHYDFARKEETNAFESLGTGNRIATWLTYMTDVEAGGATVFPYIGVKLFPKKGTAAFWYNLYQNGEGIYNTRHAACPVLVGTKWVSNKWIHERGQEFRRRCGLYADE